MPDKYPDLGIPIERTPGSICNSDVLDRYPNSKAAPEALYWKGVSQYKATNDHTVLGELPAEYQQKYPDSVWALKTIAWTE